MIIHPEIQVTPDCPTVRFRDPREQVNLDVEIPRVLHNQGWACGTYFNVQFISHDRTRLLSSALFVVSEEIESIRTDEVSQYQSVTKTVQTRRSERISKWWTCDEGVPEELEDSIKPLPKLAYDKSTRMHQVKSGEEVLYESKFKGKAIEFQRLNAPV